ncbi:hypothetical protein [Pueribacillus sp. YX66]|uniref:hypothetical protein n=1 Tax=Pueribacillus sp. YX66 TaxID=3229242 RepID=UPI00358D5497
MRCGAKRFLVEVEADGGKQYKTVIARTPAEARKMVRLKCGDQIHVISVRRE